MSVLVEFLETHRSWALGFTLFSVLCFAGSLVALPVLVARAPVDYFVTRDTHRAPLIRVVLRNLVGLVLFVAGVLMLVLPGQGMLTVLASLSLLDFPGKRRLVKKLITRPGVSRALQWLRHKANKPPFQLP